MSDSAPGPARRPFWRTVVKLVTELALVAAVVVLAGTAWANSRREGRFSFRVFDRSWWGVGRHEAQPYLSGARQAADEAYTAVWGEKGMVEKAEAWLDGLRRRRAPAAAPVAPVHGADPPAAAPAPVPAPAPATGGPAGLRLHEERFAAAERLFQQGFAAYKQANPQEGGWSAEKRETMRQAAGCFARARDLLDDAIPGYAAIPGHDVRRLGEARDLERINKQFLVNANRVGGGL